MIHFKKMRNLVCCIFILLLFYYTPTGWIYDLWAGVGTEQGQRPGAEVALLLSQEDIQSFFWTDTPATVSGERLVPCPLARLRDLREEGESRGRHGRRYHTSEYVHTEKGDSILARMSLSNASYNRYYLAALADGSWLCVYFDDYLTLANPEQLPTGYLRYATTEEKSMLHEMAEDYPVELAYVLDMYQHGKVYIPLDLLLRFAVLAIAAAGLFFVGSLWKEERLRKHPETMF